MSKRKQRKSRAAKARKTVAIHAKPTGSSTTPDKQGMKASAKQAPSESGVKSNQSGRNAEVSPKGTRSTPTPKKTSPTSGFSLGRRHMLGLLAAVPLAGVAGVSIHRYDQKQRIYHDLSVVGQGTPTIVQIHDPSCRLCRRLQKNTLEALDTVSDIHYRVADITTKEGFEFQSRYNVPHVTLLLFNENGRRVDTIQGVTPVDTLIQRFKRHFG